MREGGLGCSKPRTPYVRAPRRWEAGSRVHTRGWTGRATASGHARKAGALPSYRLTSNAGYGPGTPVRPGPQWSEPES